jgi:hypothetical protein
MIGDIAEIEPSFWMAGPWAGDNLAQERCLWIQSIYQSRHSSGIANWQCEREGSQTIVRGKGLLMAVGASFPVSKWIASSFFVSTGFER